jgi:starvation-inducible DNA-binding protein
MKKFEAFVDFIREEVEPNLGLNTKDNKTVVSALRVLLADLHVFSIKVHNFHWNVSNTPFFGSLHKLFDDVYNHTQEQIDKTAERIRQIGSITPGSMKEFLNATTLKEENGELREPSEMLKKITADLEALSKFARIIVIDTKTDQGTVNMLADMVETLEKDAWLVRENQHD